MKLFTAGLALAAATVMAVAGATAQESSEAAVPERTPSKEGARVYIVAPADGTTVTSPVTVVFGLAGMGIAPAGIQVDGTGHHHLLVNAPLPALDLPLPGGASSIHFGGGQTETVLDLPPGEHTLRLVFADWRHVPHEPPVISEPITITVE